MKDRLLKPLFRPRTSAPVEAQVDLGTRAELAQRSRVPRIDGASLRLLLIEEGIIVPHPEWGE